MVAALAVSLVASARSTEPSRVTIGVLANRGAEQCLAKWTPTAEYLTAQMPGHAFAVVPLGYDEVRDCVEADTADFILANPSFYVVLEARYGVSRIVTMRDTASGKTSTVFGGVIVARGDRDDIRNVDDLRGKSFMATDQLSLGGWRAVWRELIERGVDPHRDFADLSFGHTYDAVIRAIADGRVDAGCVRTDTLERLDAEGAARMADFRVIPCNPDAAEGFPFQLSTRLYPEWPLAKTRQTSLELAERVAVALLQMTSDDNAARAGGYAGWTVPRNYQPVRDCLKALGAEPYDDIGALSLKDVAARYWPWLALVVVFVSLAAATTVYVARLNQRLRESTALLETEFAERLRVEEMARRRQSQLAEVSRLNAIEEVASGLSHELNQPLCAISATASGCLRMMKAHTGVRPEVLEGIENVGSQAERAGQVMWRLLRLFHRRQPNPALVDIGDVIRESIDFISAKTTRHGVKLRLELSESPLSVRVDSVQIEQVLLNLTENAMEAMERLDERERELTIGAKRAASGEVEITVADTGVGFPVDDQEKIFDQFYTTKTDHAGIGLSISRSIVEAHGGRLWARGKPDQGAVVRFVLPPVEAEASS